MTGAALRPYRRQPAPLSEERLRELRRELAALPVAIAAHLAYFALQKEPGA